MKTYSRKKQGDTTDVIIHLNELCRLCLTKEDELIPIFNDDDPVPLTLRIMACASLVVSLNIPLTDLELQYFVYQVFEGDGLPNMICHPCRYQLDKCYAFKKKCENSDVKLKRHIKYIQEKDGQGDEVMDLTEENAENETVIEEKDSGKF